MNIVEVSFFDINHHDDMHLIVDEMSEKVVFEREKWLNSNERLWVKIFEDGTSRYGLEMQHDPLHGNQKYTWSSRPEVINDYLELDDEHRLARYSIGIKSKDDGYTYYSRGILLKSALEIAKKYEDKLHYGFEQFKSENQ